MDQANSSFWKQVGKKVEDELKEDIWEGSQAVITFDSPIVANYNDLRNADKLRILPITEEFDDQSNRYNIGVLANTILVSTKPIRTRSSNENTINGYIISAQRLESFSDGDIPVGIVTPDLPIDSIGAIVDGEYKIMFPFTPEALLEQSGSKEITNHILSYSGQIKKESRWETYSRSPQTPIVDDAKEARKLHFSSILSIHTKFSGHGTNITYDKSPSNIILTPK